MYDPAEVSNLTHEIVSFLSSRNEDIGIKTAALKTAAATFEHTVQAQTMAGVIHNLLKDNNPR